MGADVARRRLIDKVPNVGLKQVALQPSIDSRSRHRGLNDDLNVPVLQGTCTTCHDTPNSGNHSIPAPLDIGLTGASRRTPDLPLYTLRHAKDPF